MFKGAADFNLDLTQAGGKWDTGEVTTMQNMFNGAAKFDKDLTSWKTKLSKVTNNVDMFTNSGLSQSSVLRRQPCTDPATVSATLNWRECPLCAESKPQFADKTKLKAAVDACLGKVASGVGCCAAGADCGVAGTGAGASEMRCWDVSLVTDMEDLFRNTGVRPTSQFNVDISSWDTAAVTDMAGMFAGASAFNKDIGTWDVSKVTSMTSMFLRATAF